jgi:hypothetical protein
VEIFGTKWRKYYPLALDFLNGFCYPLPPRKEKEVHNEKMTKKIFLN